MSDVLLIGGGGHAKVVADVAHASGYRIGGFTDPGGNTGQQVNGVPWLGNDSALASILASGIRQAIVAVGDNTMRARLAAHAAELGFELVNAIHPTAWISSTATLGFGVVVMPGVVVNASSIIGDQVILNTCASIDHDCHIGPNVHIAPGARLAGSVTVEAGALVGVGAVVGRGRRIHIGCNAVIGVGSTVIHDVDAGATVVGSPARPLTGTASPRTCPEEPSA